MKLSVVLTLTTFIALSFNVEETSSARILALFPYIGKSHFNVFEPYLEVLARRGHDVVVVSHFPRTKPLANYTDISVLGSVNKEYAFNSFYLENYWKERLPFADMFEFAVEGPQDCRTTLSHENVQQLIKSDQKFDLIITEVFNTDCYLGFVHKFKCPFISFSSHGLMPWASERFANPQDPSYITNLFEAASDVKTFAQRLYSTVHYIALYFTYDFFFENRAHPVAKEFFGDDLPPLKEIAKNTSLLLLNTHFSLNRPRPYVPGIIEVGGIHLKPSKPLSKNLQQFLDSCTEGVIYFSMGSMIRSSSFPNDKRQALLDAFLQLPYKVLWKWEDDQVPGLPSNVKIEKWLPQYEILCHPNVRAFLSHGGLLGTIEATYCGVPMVGIPIYGDQDTNLKNVEASGMGVIVYYPDITKETILSALQTVLYNPSYAENAKRISAAFRDRPMSPMETAVYWTEYVLRHRGARHMKTAAVDLPLYQYLLLDVMAVTFGALGLGLYVVYFILVKISATFRRKPKRKQKIN
ncbi:UDP-glycosyltransferase UGT5 [Anabrus simplex]|uniref:UDP-glycosyltransferase UGT5 n=1 Tax=Anabrus simplex TaxID=316456 RepID=UPI0035A2FFAD